MDLNLDGNAAVVAASSSGLGKASAIALAREGADVVINGRDQARLDEAVRDVETEATGRVVGHQGDITDPDHTTALVERGVEEFGGIDHLVTSAGGPPSGLLADTSDEDWYYAFDLLVMSVVRLVRAARPHLESDDGGSIVNITSKATKEASESVILSNSVRMAVIGLEKTLSRELAPAVRVNTVLPGAHEGPRVKELFTDSVERGEYESYEAAKGARESIIPLDRLGDPIELGDAVAFLCSERSSFITGTALQIDGGEIKANL